jgi:WD40 repeat protein
MGLDRKSQPVLELWNFDEGIRLMMLDAHVSCLQFSPDGRRFAVSGSTFSSSIKGPFLVETKIKDRGLEIWDTATRRIERVLQTPGPDALKFSPDGRRLLAIYTGARAILFDVDIGREVQTWKINKGDWHAFAVNPDGTLLASGGEDKMIRLWDAASGQQLARWPGHDGGVTALLFSQDGQTLYSGSQDGTLKLWNLPFIRKELKSLNLDW